MRRIVTAGLRAAGIAGCSSSESSRLAAGREAIAYSDDGSVGYLADTIRPADLAGESPLRSGDRLIVLGDEEDGPATERWVRVRIESGMNSGRGAKVKRCVIRPIGR